MHQKTVAVVRLNCLAFRVILVPLAHLVLLEKQAMDYLVQR